MELQSFLRCSSAGAQQHTACMTTVKKKKKELKKSHNHENIENTQGPFSQATLPAGQCFFTAECVDTFSSFYFLSFLEYKHLFSHFLFL